MSYGHGVYDERSGQYRSKFGRSHSRQCVCADCQDSMDQHEKQRGYPCTCEDCYDTRNQLELIAKTEEQGRRKAKRRDVPVANIAICDRPECESMAKSSALGNVEIHTIMEDWHAAGDGERVVGQLCPACVAELMAWWEGPVKNRDRAAYGKPWVREPERKDTGELTSGELFRLALEKSKSELEATE